MYRLLRYVPKKRLSKIVGALVHLPLPRPLARRSVRWFANAFDIDTAAASKPLEDYESIGLFFTRELQPGVRPIEGELVSPVDATLRGYGVIENGRLEQIKGKNYELEAFVADPEWVGKFDHGTFFNFYLSPQDYHHIHSPVSGNVVRSVHIPGHLWPVNDWSLRSIESLFAVNERIVTYLDSAFGLVAVVMIGATNVGKMSITYDTFVSNDPARLKTEIHDYPKPVTMKAGDRIGTFHMGSSVVVLFQKGKINLDKVGLAPGAKVKFGQALVRGPRTGT